MANRTKLAVWRERRGISTTELQRRSGIPEAQLARMESGDEADPPDLRSLVSAAHALAVPLQELLEENWLLPMVDDRPIGPPVQLASAEPADTPARPAIPVLDEARSLVRWLNSPNFKRFTANVSPEQAVIAQARTQGLNVMTQRLVVSYAMEPTVCWLLFADHRLRAELAGVIVRIGPRFHLLAREDLGGT